MGTLQNGVERVFQVIAEACAGLDAQLVLSLGTGSENLAPPSGNPIVVRYAPQLELLRRSALTITHGGLNTVLESLSIGVPLVVIPVTNDQPGVGARVEWTGTGKAIPVQQVTAQTSGERFAACSKFLLTAKRLTPYRLASPMGMGWSEPPMSLKKPLVWKHQYAVKSHCSLASGNAPNRLRTSQADHRQRLEVFGGPQRKRALSILGDGS